MKYFLDTNMCIYYLKGAHPPLLTKMRSHNPDDIKIPAIVKAELVYGAEKSVHHKENLEKVNAFLLPFEIVPFGDAAASAYGKIRAGLEKAGSPIGPNDLLIAAAVLAENAILVTNNEREFNRVSGLLMENWVQ